MLAYLDDWPDDALCGWMQQSSPPEYIVEEVKKRGILCTDGVASIDPNASQNGAQILKALKALKFTTLSLSEEMLRRTYSRLHRRRVLQTLQNSFKEYQLAFLQNQLICGFRLRQSCL